MVERVSTDWGVSEFMSPSSIVEGKPKPNMNTKRIAYGSYAMVFVGTQKTKKTWHVGACQQFLHSYKWDELPIGDEVIAKVDELEMEEDGPFDG